MRGHFEEGKERGKRRKRGGKKKRKQTEGTAENAPPRNKFLVMVCWLLTSVAPAEILLELMPSGYANSSVICDDRESMTFGAGPMSLVDRTISMSSSKANVNPDKAAISISSLCSANMRRRMRSRLAPWLLRSQYSRSARRTRYSTRWAPTSPDGRRSRRSPAKRTCIRTTLAANLTKTNRLKSLLQVSSSSSSSSSSNNNNKQSGRVR